MFSASVPRTWLIGQAAGSLEGLTRLAPRRHGAHGELCLAQGASLSEPWAQPSSQPFTLLTSGCFLGELRGSLNIYILKVNF